MKNHGWLGIEKYNENAECTEEFELQNKEDIPIPYPVPILAPCVLS